VIFIPYRRAAAEKAKAKAEEAAAEAEEIPGEHTDDDEEEEKDVSDGKRVHAWARPGRCCLPHHQHPCRILVS
jgi:hypothetical protein